MREYDRRIWEDDPEQKFCHEAKTEACRSGKELKKSKKSLSSFPFN